MILAELDHEDQVHSPECAKENNQISIRVNMTMSVGLSITLIQTKIGNYWMDCYDILYPHSCSPQDE